MCTRSHVKELSCFFEIVVESVTVIGSRFHSRGQCFNFQSIRFMFLFSISQSFKAWMRFKPVEPDGHHYISFILWFSCKLEKERELKCLIIRYLDQVTRYNREKNR